MQSKEIIIKSISINGRAAWAVLDVSAAKKVLARIGSSKLIYDGVTVVVPLHRLPLVSGRALKLQRSWERFFEKEAEKLLKI